MSTSGEAMPRVVVSHDKMRAELVIGSLCTAEAASASSLLSIVMDAGIELAPGVRRRIEELAGARRPGEECIAEIATGTSPVHGIDARIEWEPDPPESSTADAFHLRRIGAIRVTEGQKLGAIVPPVPGQDGRDVFGRTIAARTGKPVGLRFADGILVDGRGLIWAQVTGILVRTTESASISTVLDIETPIDPATKLVEFEGSVIIRKAITPGVSIRVAGDLEAHGPIESADIDCRGDMVAHGGITSRGGNRCVIRGNCTARYLSSIEGVIAGDLRIDREIVNSRLTIGGGLIAPGASLIGGVVTVTGSVKLLQIGNESEHRTTLCLGEVPLAQRVADEAKRVHESASARVRELDAEQARLSVKGAVLGPAEKERLTELMFDLGEAVTNERVAMANRTRAEQEVRERRTIDVRVERIMHPGVVLLVQQRRYEVVRALRGPFNVRVNEHGDVVYVTPSGEHGLETVCRVAAAA